VKTVGICIDVIDDKMVQQNELYNNLPALNKYAYASSDHFRMAKLLPAQLVTSFAD